jgi:hypothetical protein
MTLIISQPNDPNYIATILNIKMTGRGMCTNDVLQRGGGKRMRKSVWRNTRKWIFNDGRDHISGGAISPVSFALTSAENEYIVNLFAFPQNALGSTIISEKL